MVAQDLARLAHAAMIARDWAVLRPLLHPYLHWTRGDGTIVRGRSIVLAMLEWSGAPAVGIGRVARRPDLQLAQRRGNRTPDRWRYPGPTANALKRTPACR